MDTAVDLIEFDTEEDAWAWVYEQVDDPCVDNERLAYIDDPDMMEDYEDTQVWGCCGSFDQEVIINGKQALIGCNYGH